MSATFRILDHRVGEGGLKHGVQVQRIQQLLRLNGFKIRTHGTWHNETADALVAFQEKSQNTGEAFFTGNIQTPKKFVAPHDSILFDLAFGAKVLIMLSAGGDIYRHAIAFDDVHDWCVEHKVGFDMRSRAVWGFEGYPNWAIVTEVSDEFGKAHAFDMETPRSLNCTLYANLMMSVWKQGNAHKYPYSANVSHAGGENHFAKDRYGYPMAGKFSDASEIRALVRKHPGRLYCLEFGYSEVGHLGLLLNDRVHECNYGPTRDVHSVSLEQWVSTHPEGWVLGPAPW